MEVRHTGDGQVRGLKDLQWIFMDFNLEYASLQFSSKFVLTVELLWDLLTYVLKVFFLCTML